MQHLLEVGQFGTHIGRVVVVAGPVDLRALNHQGKAFVVAAEHGDGLLGTLRQHVAARGSRQRVALVEQRHQLLAAEAVHAVKGVDHRVSATRQGIQRGEAVFAVLRKEIFAAAANHHIMLALSHLQTQRVEHLTVGHMAVGGGGRGVQHTAGDHKTRAHAGTLGIVEDGRIAGRVGTPVDVVVVHLVARGQRRAAGGGVGAVLVARVGARKTAVGETQEGRIVAHGGHHRGIDLRHTHAVADDENDILRHRHVSLLFLRGLLLSLALLRLGLERQGRHFHTSREQQHPRQQHQHRYTSNFHILTIYIYSLNRLQKYEKKSEKQRNRK